MKHYKTNCERNLTTDQLDSFAMQIRAIREDLDISQTRLGYLSDTSRQTVSRIECCLPVNSVSRDKITLALGTIFRWKS